MNSIKEQNKVLILNGDFKGQRGYVRRIFNNYATVVIGSIKVSVLIEDLIII